MDRLKNFLKVIKEKETQLSIVGGFLFVMVVALLVITALYYKNRGQRVADIDGGQTVEKEIPMISKLPDQPTDELPVKYVVQPGDSSWMIAQKIYGCGDNYVDIEQANNLVADQDLEIGQELIIPAVEVKCDAIIADQDITDQADEVVESEEQTYTVVKGDCLWTIAEAHYGDGMVWTQIYEANEDVVGSNPDLIYPDQVFVLPNVE